MSVALRRAEQELAQAKEETRAARLEFAQQKKELFARLSHELRTPLNEILGFAELLETENSDRRNNENVDHILRAGRRLLDFIAEALAEEPEENPADAGGGKTVLYIEDVKANFLLVLRILEQKGGFQLIGAGSGELGVLLAQNRRPDVILLDLNLPDIHGSEVLRRLRENPATADIPVIIISADAASSQIERLLQAGARDYITKPFAIRKFLAVLDGVFEQKTP